MGVLERGFKTWAENLALNIRRDLSLAAHAPLSPLVLAEHLDVKVWTPRDVPGITQPVLNQLLHDDPDGWSAVSCSSNERVIVIYNPKHSGGRQNSDIAHELAHILLEHEPSRIVLSHDGAMVMRSFDPKQEEEANWLGWCILLPRAALVRAMSNRLEVEEIAEQWAVSRTLVEYRIRMTGVRTQMSRRRRSS
jgi:hypothetical protein